MVMVAGAGGFGPGHSASTTSGGGTSSGGSKSRQRREESPSGTTKSGQTYGAKYGKGMTDRQTRAYASKQLATHGAGSTQFRDAVTFVDFSGVRKAKGTFQAMGMTSESLGFGGVADYFQSEAYHQAQRGMTQSELKHSIREENYFWNNLFGKGAETPISTIGSSTGYSPYGEQSTAQEIANILNPNRGGGGSPPTVDEEGGIGILPILLVGGLGYYFFVMKK